MSYFYFGSFKVIKIVDPDTDIEASNCGAPSDCTVNEPIDQCIGGSLYYCNYSTCSMTPFIPAQSC